MMPFTGESLEALRRAVQMVPFNHNPPDWQRFYGFVIKMHRLGAERPTEEELEQKLEEMYPDSGIPSELAQVYTHGVDMLTELPHVR
jgi:hypothetical protein